MEESKATAIDQVEGGHAENVTTMKVKNVELAAAVQTQKPSLFTKNMFIVRFLTPLSCETDNDTG